MERIFHLLTPDITHWIDMLYNPIAKNISYRMAMHFNHIDIEQFKLNVMAEDAWQDIAIIYWKQINGFKVFEYTSPSAPALYLKRQIVIHISNYLELKAKSKNYKAETKHSFIDEEAISNRIELENMDPYLRYVISIAIQDNSFENLIDLTKTESTYRCLRSMIDEDKI